MEARYVRDEDDNYESVVFAPGAPDEFQVQRALSFDEEDIRSGMDTYCLVMASGATLYGGVEEFDLDHTNLKFTFTPEAVDTLGIPREVEVALDWHDNDQIVNGLSRMLRLRAQHAGTGE